jgi:hypothetical protein
MRKISLTPYKCPDGQDYKLKESIVNLLFAPQLRLGARAAIENDLIARKVEAANGSVLLEEAEYEKVRAAIETFEGYSRNDLEFVRRVLEAETVAVREG